LSPVRYLSRTIRSFRLESSRDVASATSRKSLLRSSGSVSISFTGMLATSPDCFWPSPPPRFERRKWPLPTRLSRNSDSSRHGALTWKTSCWTCRRCIAAAIELIGRPPRFPVMTPATIALASRDIASTLARCLLVAIFLSSLSPPQSAFAGASPRSALERPRASLHSVEGAIATMQPLCTSRSIIVVLEWPSSLFFSHRLRHACHQLQFPHENRFWIRRLRTFSTCGLCRAHIRPPAEHAQNAFLHARFNCNEYLFLRELRPSLNQVNSEINGDWREPTQLLREGPTRKPGPSVKDMPEGLLQTFEQAPKFRNEHFSFRRL